MKYNIIAAEDNEEKEEFKFAVTLPENVDIIYGFEGCKFKEIEGATQLVTQVTLLEKNENSELVSIKSEDDRYETLMQNSNLILKQFIIDLTEKLKIEVDILESEVA